MCTESHHHLLMGTSALTQCPEAALPEGGLITPTGHIVQPGLDHLSRQGYIPGGTHCRATAQMPTHHRGLRQCPLLVAQVAPLPLASDQHPSIRCALSVCQPQITLTTFRGHACRKEQNQPGSERQQPQTVFILGSFYSLALIPQPQSSPFWKGNRQGLHKGQTTDPHFPIYFLLPPTLDPKYCDDER